MNTEATSTTPAQDVTGSRVGAAIVDLVIVIIIGVVFSMLFGESSGGSSDNGGTSFSFNLSGFAFIAYAVVSAGYYFIMEAATGQTLGKMLLGVKVVSAKGGPLGTGQAALRTVLRLIDGLPFLYLVGFILIIATKRKQRLGDLLADTLVVNA